MELSANQPEAEPEIPLNSAEDEEEKLDDGEGKKLWRGKRKTWNKQVYLRLLQQIEFYFSSSNLAKDRFMSKMIQEDPCKLLNQNIPKHFSKYLF